MLAFVNTLLTPACALATWFVLDLLRSRQVTAIGAATAIVVGCVGITPAAGFISPLWAMVLGVLAALPSYAVIMLRPRWRVDETLDVLAAHGVAGLTGIVFIGLLRADRLERRRRRAVLRRRRASCSSSCVAVLVTPAYAFAATFALLKLIGAVLAAARRRRRRRRSAWTSSPTARRPTPPARARSWSSSPSPSRGEERERVLA